MPLDDCVWTLPRLMIIASAVQKSGHQELYSVARSLNMLDAIQKVHVVNAAIASGGGSVGSCISRDYSPFFLSSSSLSRSSFSFLPSWTSLALTPAFSAAASRAFISLVLFSSSSAVLQRERLGRISLRVYDRHLRARPTSWKSGSQLCYHNESAHRRRPSPFPGYLLKSCRAKTDRMRLLR